MNAQQKLILEIHNEFDTAQERLLTEAKSIISKNQIAHANLSERLLNVGFERNPIVKEAREKGKIISVNTEMAKIIQYYADAYPFLKFLTETELKRICAKYSLTIGPVENYTGNVPVKNLTEIENAQVLRDVDAAEDFKYCILSKDDSFGIWGAGDNWYSTLSSEYRRIPTRIDGLHFRTQYDACEWLRENMGFEKKYPVDSVTNYTEDRQVLYVCAPASEFEGKNKRITFFEVKDPIVFRYVKGGIQVLTKWGLEASDPALVVDKLN